MAAMDKLSETTEQVIRVAIVDDEPLVRGGLRLILGGDHSIDIVGEAGDGLDAGLMIARVRPNVVLMDIRMPRLDGLAATEAALAEHPQLKVIMLTTFDTDDMVLTALRIGASGFLLKDTLPEQIVDAVRQVAAGRSILSPSVTEQLIDAVARRPDHSLRTAALERLEALTDREREIAVEIGHGRTNSEIADGLFLSVATVKTHIGRVFTKLGAENRVQVAICIHEAGLT